jgi:hypothetical protein
MDLSFTPYSPDGTLPPPESSHYARFLEVVTQAAAKIGLNMDVATTFAQTLRDAGYEDVTEKIYDVPMGTWPRDSRLKEVGAFQLAQFLSAIQGIAMGLLTRVMGWSREEVEVMLVELRNELTDRQKHMFWKA